MSKELKEIRQFGFILAAMLYVISFILLLKSRPIYIWILGAATLIFIIALTRVQILSPVYSFLTGIARLIGKLNSVIILSLFFYIIIVPVGLIMKLVKKDPLQRCFNKKLDTYWIKRDKDLSKPQRMEWQF